MSSRQSLVVTTGEVSVGNAHVVRTMLDMIAWLERAGETIATVFLGGEFARDREVALFLRETYPSVELIVSSRHLVPTTHVTA